MADRNNDGPLPRQNPRYPRPDERPDLQHPVDPSATLVDSLASTVDSIRQIGVNLGTRPYQVVSVVVDWTGCVRGRGEGRVVSEKPFQPTPFVDMRQVEGESKEAGMVTRGPVKITEISPAMTELDIRDLFHLEPLPENYEGFIEVRMDARDGPLPVRYRFTVRKVPWRDPTNFQWVAEMTDEDQPRTRDGRFRNLPTVFDRPDPTKGLE